MSEGWEKLCQVTVKGAEHDSRERLPHPQCLEGTRVNLLNFIYGVLDDKSKNQLIWLHGTAGVGKSAVAFTVAERMRCQKVTEETNVEKRLAGTFFFSRKHTNRRTTGRLFATLAYQLASNFPSVKTHVNKAILEDSALLHPDGSLRNQMEALFSRPLRQLKSRLRDCPPLAFVIDALDECTESLDQSTPESLDQSTIEPFDDNKYEIALAELISLLAEALRDPDLPIIHILVTSRSEAHIHEAMQYEDVRPLVCEIPVKISGQGVAATISLDGEDVDEDIYLFLKHSFIKLQTRFPAFPLPKKVQLERLANRAGRRFIVASTMMKFIDDRHNDPYDRLELMLELTSDLLPGTEVYKLYDRILSTCADPTQAYLHLSVVAALADPLPMSQISELLGPGGGRDVERVLVQLRSVIDVPTNNSLPVNIYHSSVRDYVSHRSNCSLPQVQYITSPHSLLALSSLNFLVRKIPERTGLLDALSQLSRQSQVIKSNDPQSLKHLSSFVVQPPESLQVLIGLLWLQGHRSSELQFWLETLDGRAWLQTAEVKDWLLTQGGLDWLLTDGGSQWLLTQWGKAWTQSLGVRLWLETEGGQGWLQTDGGQVWLETKGGQSWLQTEDGRVWLGTEGGRGWLQIEGGRHWLRTESGQDWLLTNGGIQWLLMWAGGWLRSRAGNRWLQSEGGQSWLQSVSGRVWLRTVGVRVWLRIWGGKSWLQTKRGRVWLQTENGQDWLLRNGGQRVWLQSEGWQDWLQTQSGRVWLLSEDGQDWLESEGWQDWLQTQSEQVWLESEDGQDWLQTQGGRVWLESEVGQDWLLFGDGQDWLVQTEAGRVWLESEVGQDWLESVGGQDWLPTTRRQAWLQSKDGQDWLESECGQDWLLTMGGRVWLQSKDGQDWLQTERGRVWLQSEDGQDWLQSEDGQDWLRTMGARVWDDSKDGQENGQDWLQTQEGRVWLKSEDGQYWLESKGGQGWLESKDGQDWMQNSDQQHSLQTLGTRQLPSLLSPTQQHSPTSPQPSSPTPSSSADLLQTWDKYWLQIHNVRNLQTPDEQDWLQTQAGRHWLQTQAGCFWLQTQAGQGWLQSHSGRKCLQTLAGRGWPQIRSGGSWLLTLHGRRWLQTRSGEDWLQTKGGQDWLQTRCGQDWLQILGGEDWLQAESGQDWLQAESGRKWLQAESGRKWLQTEGGRDWLQNQGGREWLLTPYGQTWRLSTIWVTMEELSSTLQALKEYMIAPDMRLHPAFQVIQQLKNLPDFLMFPVFLALRHQDQSPATSPRGHLSPDIEIIDAMKVFSRFAYEAREESQSASDVLNYACQNWVVHLSRAPDPWDEKLSLKFQSFWDRNLLSWLARQWCLKDLRSCLTILSEGEKIAKQHLLRTPGLSQ